MTHEENLGRRWMGHLLVLGFACSASLYDRPNPYLCLFLDDQDGSRLLSNVLGTIQSVAASLVHLEPEGQNAKQWLESAVRARVLGSRAQAEADPLPCYTRS